VTERRIYRLAASCLALVGLAFVLPRFVPSSEGGFASAATAVLVFLAVLAVAAVVALYLCALTIRAYRDLALLPRFAGIAPAVILIVALAMLMGGLRY
jgi:hypothetical protein